VLKQGNGQPERIARTIIGGKVNYKRRWKRMDWPISW